MKLYKFLGVTSLILWLFVLYLELRCAFYDLSIIWPFITLIISIIPTMFFYRLDKTYGKND